MAGALAGLAGTATMMAMRMFDETYAPKTIPKTRRDPGRYMMRKAEAATNLPKVLPQGAVRRQIENAGAMSMQVGYGILPGIAYAMLRGQRRNGSSLVEGAAIGMGVYLLGYFGWLPLLGLTRPLWKQPLPEVVGETMRHVAYGVTTAAVYGALESVGSEAR
jgi:hypothetical protein